MHQIHLGQLLVTNKDVDSGQDSLAHHHYRPPNHQTRMNTFLLLEMELISYYKEEITTKVWTFHPLEPIPSAANSFSSPLK
jgi:hypothetical protein